MVDVTSNSYFSAAGNCQSAYQSMQTAPRENRVESESSILKRHARMIRYIAIPFAGRGGSLDDLTQEGSIALLDAYRKWDGTLGVTLATYAWKFVFGAMVKYTSREVAEPAVSGLRDGAARRARAGDGSSDEGHIKGYTENLEASEPSPEEQLETSECVAILARDFSYLDETERRVARLHLDGYSFVDIALGYAFVGMGLAIRGSGDRVSVTSNDKAERIYHGAVAKLRERVGAQL